MKVQVYGYNGKPTGQEVDLPDEIFNYPIKKHLFYYVVRWQLAKRRRGTASTKTRGEVSGGGRKIRPQKGLGMSRQGSIRAPHWRGGGVVFGAKPRDYEYRLPKKVRKLAVKSALSYRVKNNEFYVVEDFKVPEIKTKHMVKFLENFGVEGGLLLIPERDEVIELSARNIPDLRVLRVEGLNVFDILNYSPLFVKVNTIPLIERRLKL